MAGEEALGRLFLSTNHKGAMRMKKIIGLVIVLAMLITPVAAFAASPWTQADTYGDKVSGKLEFGIKNTLLGWIDLFYEPNRAENAWSGLGKGISDSIINIGGGAFHLVTFLIPVDLPLPDNGVAL